MQKLCKEFEKSVGIMDTLRGKNGCPWDREQTQETLKKYIIEEAFEVVEALESKDKKKIAEELGDLYFQVLFQSRIGKEKGAFTLFDVIKNINDKMIRRHPHVFGDLKGKVKDSKKVLINWTKTKRKEGKKSVIDGVPKKMPSLLRAYRITEKASTVGFDWRNVEEILEKLDEEINEFKQARKKSGKKSSAEIEDEIGDMLFTVVNVSRFLNVDPDSALRKTIDKFRKRFNYIERSLKRSRKDIRDVGIEEMEELWVKSKKEKKCRRRV